MNSAFSPLEALLLFQYLANYGVSPTVFPKISDLLKNDEQIRRANSFDPGRLSPDALHDFYLRQLKEEARNELAAAENDGLNGDSLGASRKRKAPSPTLPTIQEASKNAHLIPQLIRKLYARYREHATIEIKADESRYVRLQRDIKDIKSGSWDEKLAREIDRGEWDHVLKRDLEAQARPPGPSTPAAAVAGLARQSSTKNLEEASKTDSIQQKPAEPVQPLPPAIPQPSRTTAASPSPLPSATSPRQPLPNQPYPAQPANVQQTPHAQQTPSTMSTFPADGQSPGQTPSMPPPPTPANYPSQQLPPYPYTNNAQAPQRPPSRSPYPAIQPIPSPRSPQAAGYPPYGGPIQPSYTYGPSPGGVMLQPFAVAPQTPTGPPRQQGQQSQNVPLNNRSGQPPRGPSLPHLSTQFGASLTPFDIARLLSTPLTARRLSPAVIPSPSSATKWKPLPGRAVRGPRKSSPVRPGSRSVSPISESAVSPPPETTRRSKRGQLPTSAPDIAPPARTTRRRARGGSTTSSIPGSSVRGRTRSQSVMSHAEDVSMMDNESVTGRRVKNEPSTPADGSDFVRPTTEETPNLGSTRRGVLPPNVNKRKRGARDDSEASDTVAVPRQDKSVVIAARNFNRLSATIMNDIQSHKHASLFSNPVRDRDAEGYSEMIKRPQDLKSIRAAITAGNRAVNAAAASDSFASSTSSQRDAGGSVVLPVTEDLVPPKAIVNSGQLEKEVMRMLANAVMFNQGDADVVRDAREMFGDVETTINKFRDVERSSGSLAIVPEGGRRESEEGVEEEEVGSAKRRRLG